MDASLLAGRRSPNLRTAERLAEGAGLEMTADFGLPVERIVDVLLDPRRLARELRRGARSRRVSPL